MQNGWKGDGRGEEDENALLLFACWYVYYYIYKRGNSTDKPLKRNLKINLARLLYTFATEWRTGARFHQRFSAACSRTQYSKDLQGIIIVTSR